MGRLRRVRYESNSGWASAHSMATKPKSEAARRKSPSGVPFNSPMDIVESCIFVFINLTTEVENLAGEIIVYLVVRDAVDQTAFAGAMITPAEGVDRCDCKDGRQTK